MNPKLAFLSPYQQRVENALKKQIDETSSPLQQACSYALVQGGKRLRPALVLIIAHALGAHFDALEAALSVEYCHTASLIADDLPCMDNDQERRGKPSTHIVYGESVALLASYALIAAAYEAIAKNTETLRAAGHKQADRIGILALHSASINTGIDGATQGQYLDLVPPKIDFPTYQETVIKKTVSLFEISMVFGWLFGGGDPDQLSLIKKTAYHFGMAFQIADDFDDAKEDLNSERQMNAVSLLGLEKAKQLFQKELEAYFHCLELLKIDATELRALGDYLNQGV